MKKVFFLVFVATGILNAHAGEGMWLPVLLDSLNYKDMQEKGLRLTPDQIYSINEASLKDAIVLFGNGCTGEVISPDGLLITNHHCGYSRIQSHSTVEKNYLANGFWAGSKSEELANPGLSVSFLVRMENVTSEVLHGIAEDMPEKLRDETISIAVNRIRQKAINGTHYQAEVKSFYFGREYYLFVYEVFNDVRLVGTPPEAIGNFGGDTDNWIWPRHTGDFSLFRIYADKDNQPALYSPDNVPYKPKKHLNISTRGVEAGDFTMILGYPARTDQYLTSDALNMIAGKSYPAKVEMRTARLNAIQEVMDRGPRYKLQYASKHKNISNAWKKWMGVVKGIERAGVIAGKLQTENEFSQWASQLKEDTSGFAALMDEFKALYKVYEPLYLANDLGGELLNSIELSSMINRFQIRFFAMFDSSQQFRTTEMNNLRNMGKDQFNTSALEIDRKVLPVLLRIYAENNSNAYHPDFYGTIRKDYNNDYNAYVSWIFDNSIFTDSLRYLKVLDKSEKRIRKKLINDPLIAIYRDFSILLLGEKEYMADSLELEMRKLYRNYVAGLMLQHEGQVFYPDANFSMRLTYGMVQGYNPADGVEYDYYSTLDGVMEKEDPEIADYKVPAGLRNLYTQADYGSYSKDGKVPVCFIATNHTSGGNSGSPVLDADGNLIGINFDRNWEGTVSDFAYDPLVCRNISLDVRYVLFIIDKLANADWLLNELTLIKN